MSTSLLVNGLNMTLKFKKRDFKFDTVFINKIEFQNKNSFDINRKNFVF